MSKQHERKRIYIVEDHPVFRTGLVGMIHREPGWAVCGHAENATRAFTEIGRLKPDLVLADIGLPGRSGLELLKDILTAWPHTAVLVLSMHDETLYAERVLRAGGRGYIMKQEDPESILDAVRQVLEGQIYLSGKMSARILDDLSRRPRNHSSLSRLTDRELEVLQLIGQGKDSHAIARQLKLSFKTVDAHRSHIKEKLKLKSGTELICYSARWVVAQSARAA